MLNFKNLLSISILFISCFFCHVALPNDIEKLTIDLKTISNILTEQNVTTKFETQIINICSAIEKIRLQQFIKANQTTFAKLSSITEKAFDLFMSSLKNIENYSSTDYKQNPQKAALIDELFGLFKFGTIKMQFAFFIIQSTPSLNLNKEAIEQKITTIIKNLLDTNLTDTEISNLIAFSKSSAFQRISLHANKFMQIVMDSLSPAIAEQLKRCFETII